MRVPPQPNSFVYSYSPAITSLQLYECENTTQPNSFVYSCSAAITSLQLYECECTTQPNFSDTPSLLLSPVYSFTDVRVPPNQTLLYTPTPLLSPVYSFTNVRVPPQPSYFVYSYCAAITSLQLYECESTTPTKLVSILLLPCYHQFTTLRM